MKKSMLLQVVDISAKAGQAIMAVIGTTSKADNSPLTDADMASHRIIVDDLRKLTPDIPILSEEAADISYVERSQWTRFWLVDPLDGTKEFIKSNGEFTVNKRSSKMANLCWVSCIRQHLMCATTRHGGRELS